MAGLLAAGVYVFTAALTQTTERTIAQNAERLSTAWAAFFISTFEDLETRINTDDGFDEEFLVLARSTATASVFRFKLFDASGRLVLVSDEALMETRLADHNPSALNVLRDGRTMTFIEDGTDKPDRPKVYVESYAPIIVDDRIIGVAEVYVDQTADAASIRRGMTEFGAEVSVALLLCLCPAFIALYRARRRMSLRNDQLRAARDEAMAAEKAKSEFLANMSHESRTPMNGVIGMAELMTETELDQRQKMFAEITLSSAKSLLGVINDILDFSKIDAGHLKIEPAPFALADAANLPAQLLSKSAFDKGVELLVNVDPRLPEHVVGDFGRIRQLVTNLLGNAVKFTAHGEVVLKFSAVENDADQGAPLTLRIEIRDTGPGIAEDKLALIFEKFTQVDGSSSREFEGTGLGLAISKGLVDLMAGRIGARSVVGVGSVFWAEVPLGAADAPQRPPAPKVDLTGKRILVVDDNETNRLILSELLSSWGVEDAAAHGGREGLQKLRSAVARGRPFDLILLDHHMPDMSGEVMLTAIRGEAPLANTAVIVLSSMDQFEIFEAAATARPEATLAKPVDAAALRKIVGDVLSARAPATPEPAPAVSAAGAEAIAAPALKAAAAPSPKSQSGGILLIEDNHINQTIACEILKSMGLDVMVADNGRRGVNAFLASSPRLILMDISMPILNGYDACAEIRALEAERGSPACHIVGMTAHAMEGDREKCLSAGMDDYLSKPINVSELRSVVERSTV
ncbi:MAG: response regulator [Pseudomonadota bacterium]